MSQTYTTQSDYIKRQDAIEAVRHAWAKGLEPTQYIEDIHAADVEPVKRGKWEPHPSGSLICSCCHD